MNEPADCTEVELDPPAPRTENQRSEGDRLADRAYRRILDLILSGDMRPGEHLNERRLSALLEISRTPVRDALLMLETEGLIVRHGRMGVQIKQMQIEEYMDALQIRLLLEPDVARIAAGRIAAADLGALEGELRKALSAAEAGQTMVRERTRWIDDRLHGAILAAAGNAQLTAIVENLRRKTQIFDLRNLPERAVATCREHIDILEALCAGDGPAAAAAMTRHLEGVRASIIARLVR